MSRVSENWERLVRATLQREQLRSTGPGAAAGKTTAGLAAAVPPSLGKQTNIDAILQAADDIEDEDPNVARICEFRTLIELNFSFVVLEILYFLENWVMAAGK